MLTAYERYQLEWMIEHGHSLKEFVQGLGRVDLDGIDSLEDAYAIWENDYGFGGEVFSVHELMKNTVMSARDSIFLNPETSVLIANNLDDPMDPAIEVFPVTLDELRTIVSKLEARDYDNPHLDTLGLAYENFDCDKYESIEEVEEKGLLDKGELLDVSNVRMLADVTASLKSERGMEDAFEVARIKGELAMYNAAYYNPETGDLIVSYLADYEDPTVEVFSAKTYELYKFTAQLTPDDIEYGETTHELAGQFAHHVATYHTLEELVSAGYLDNKNLLDVSSTEKLFKTGLAIATAEGSDIDLLVKRDIEEGRTVYALDRGIAIASYLDDAENPRIEVSHYAPYELASLVNARMAPDALDIRDVLTDPSRPRAFDHEVATFDSIDDFLARMGSPTSISWKWLPMCGDRLEPSMKTFGIKQTDNVREWYTLAFPGDELAVAINPSLTFDDAIAAVPTGDGFYTALGDAADSLLRERIFEELCNRYGYTYDEVYDSWLNESPLPSPAISQQPEKIAVAAGYRFNIVDVREASGIDLKDCGTVVTVDGHDYNVMKGATYEDSRKVDDLLDSHGDKPISDYRKRPQGMSLKQAVMESRAASDRLSAKNGGTDAPDGKDER